MLKTSPTARFRQTVHRLIGNVVQMKQSVNNIHLNLDKCFLVCREEPSYLNAVVVVRKLVPYFFLIKVITNCISCVYCVDLGDIIYIVYIFCIFTRVFLFNKYFLLVNVLSEVLIVIIPTGEIIHRMQI